MLNALSAVAPTWNLQGQTAPPPIGIGLAEGNLWFYRPRTAALLRRYGRLSVEVGRLPSLLGKDIFRSRLAQYSAKNFEDAAVFVADIERVLDQLSDEDRRMLAMNVLEDYTVAEVARLLQCSQRTVERKLFAALDHLSGELAKIGML
jgi:RNA polymerase sigma factor (sigma-70 family)